MKKIEEEFLKDFADSLGSASSFEEIEGKIDSEKYRRGSSRKHEKAGSRRRFWGLLSAAAIVLVAAIIIPTAVLFRENGGESVSQADPSAPSAPQTPDGTPSTGGPSIGETGGETEGDTGSAGSTPEDHLYDNATVALLKEHDCLFFEDLAFAEDGRNHVFVIRGGEIAEHYSYEKQVYRDDSFDSVRNKSMIEAVETIGIPSYTGPSELSLDYSFNDGYIRRVKLARADGELTVDGVEVLDKENPSTWLDPDKTSLPTKEQCGQITVGMSLDEVVALIGRPQRDVGSGAILYQFDVEGGEILQIRFDSDVEQENKYVHDNPNAHIYGSHCLCVGSVGFTGSLPDVHDWGKQ